MKAYPQMSWYQEVRLENRMTSKELQEARRKLGLTQAALGWAIGVSSHQVQSMETGRREIGFPVELAIRYRLIEAGLATMADFAN